MILLSLLQGLALKRCSVGSCWVQANISHKVIQAFSPNESVVVQQMRLSAEHYFVFSPQGILGEALDAGKKIIHVHPGKLPEYRGSTCFYYSLLAEDAWYCSAFIMDRGIDSGQIILSEKFPPPTKGTNEEDVYDPYTRSVTLLKVIKLLYDNKGLQTYDQDLSKGKMLYIIHPVLRAIVKKRIDAGDYL